MTSIIDKIGFGEGFFEGVGTEGAEIKSDGSGSAGQAASLTGSISAMVVEILANGNLVIIGEKQLALTEGTEFIRVKGIIRPADIQPDNTILSSTNCSRPNFLQRNWRAGIRLQSVLGNRVTL